MGDRTFWTEDCLECKGKGTVEGYDAPSSLNWLVICENCGWSDGKSYYETNKNSIELLTEEQAKSRGLIK